MHPHPLPIVELLPFRPKICTNPIIWIHDKLIMFSLNFVAIFTFLCQYRVRKLKTVKFQHSFRQITNNSFYKSFARFVLHKFYKKSNCKEHFIKTHSNGSIHISTVSFVEITAIIWRLFLTLKKLCNNTYKVCRFLYLHYEY